MNKKNIYIGVGIFFLVLVLIVLFFLQSSKEKSANPQVFKTKAPNVNQAVGGGVGNTQQSVSDESLMPEEVVKSFYDRYSVSPAAFLSTGDYKKQYVSDELIKWVQKRYNGRNDPLFCPANMRQDFVFDDDVNYSKDGVVAYVTMREATDDATQLYAVELDKINGQWLISRIQCLH
jgi:hypothetical protein